MGTDRRPKHLLFLQNTIDPKAARLIGGTTEEIAAVHREGSQKVLLSTLHGNSRWQSRNLPSDFCSNKKENL
jgi:hypothetical protein